MEFIIILSIIFSLLIGLLTLKYIKKSPEKPQNCPKKTLIQKKHSFSYGKLNIFYGSQSGTAIKFSNILQEEARQNSFDAQVIDLQNYQDTINKEPFTSIYVVATHGEGDPTDNSKDFFVYLESQKAKKATLSGSFTVFGLGNTQYEHYNAVGRRLNGLLEEVGGKRIYKYGEGDDNSSLEDDFNEWKTNIWSELQKVIVPVIQDEVKQINKLNLVLSQEAKNQTLSTNTSVYQFQTQAFLNSSECKLLSIEEIRQNNQEGSTLHLQIELNEGKEYHTGQNLGIFPENDIILVKDIGEYLGVDLQNEYVWENNSEKDKLPFPTPLTAEKILKQYCDFQGQIMKKTLKDLAKICTEKENKQQLEYLSSPQGKSDFQKCILDEKKTLFDILKQFKLKPSFNEFIQFCPRINPRIFTISSSNVRYQNQVHITSSIVSDYIQTTKQSKIGLCSKYLQELKQQRDQGACSLINVRIDFRESSFKLPSDLKKKILMVAAGTGIAPFIGFCQEKECLLQRFGEFELYFGCKKQSSDFIFKEQVEEFIKKQVLNQFYPAFSRDQENKIYVQDLIKQNGKNFVRQILEQNAALYICGSKQMGNSVISTLNTLISEYKSIDFQQSNEIIKQLETNHQIIKELW